MPGGFDGITPKEETQEEKIERLKRAMYSRKISDSLGERPRRPFEETRQAVGEDWERPEPALPASRVAPGVLRAARAAAGWLFGLAVAFFVGAVAFFIYFFFFGAGATPVSPGNIDITISGPLQISSGEPTELQIAVQNRNRMALELAELVIKYPKGTRSPTDLTTDLPDQRIPLGTIESGGRRQGTVSAVFAGQEGDRASVRVELEYRLVDSNAVFVARSDYQLLFASSPISFALEGNTETVAGQPVEFRLTLASNTDTPVKDLILNMLFPFGFSLSSADPQPVKGTLWELGDFNPGQKKTVTVRGVVNGESGDERVFRFTAGTRKQPSDTRLSAVFADYAHHLRISEPFLGLSVILNRDAANTTTVVGPGETVTVAIQYVNNLSSPVTDAVIVAQMSDVEIDGATVRSNDGFYRSSDRVMLWDKTTAPTLAVIPPGGRGSVNFSFQAPSGDVIKDIRDPRVTLSVQAAGKRVSEMDVPETLQSAVVETIRLASDLQLVAQGLYYSNPFGSSGPMPPKAGSETTYAIVFSLTNTTNEITNAVVKAKLPAYVRWTGVYSPSAEDITFNQNDGTMTWKVGTIGANVGVNGSLPKQAAIAVGFTPSTSQIGQQPPLIRSITLTGKDTTGQTISRTTEDVTTNILGDQGFIPSNATVVK